MGPISRAPIRCVAATRRASRWWPSGVWILGEAAGEDHHELGLDAGSRGLVEDLDRLTGEDAQHIDRFGQRGNVRQAVDAVHLGQLGIDRVEARPGPAGHAERLLGEAGQPAARVVGADDRHAPGVVEQRQVGGCGAPGLLRHLSPLLR